MTKELEYTIKAKFKIPTDRVPDKNIEDIKAEIGKIGGYDILITSQKLVTV